MIHTERIIERSTKIWSEWPGRRITRAEAATLRDTADIEEIRIEVADSATPYFISWKQEDGASDDTLFHWLSMQHTSHFNEARLQVAPAPPVLRKLEGLLVERIELYGRRDLDAVVAAIVVARIGGVGLATARDLTNKVRFSRFGVAELAVTDEDRLRHELARQELEKIVAIGEASD